MSEVSRRDIVDVMFSSFVLIQPVEHSLRVLFVFVTDLASNNNIMFAESDIL